MLFLTHFADQDFCITPYSFLCTSTLPHDTGSFIHRVDDYYRNGNHSVPDEAEYVLKWTCPGGPLKGVETLYLTEGFYR